ncbi:MAG: hypothetical protein M3R60_07170, partial [Pseudomonadota bacterium]|nr:hypothetical protein [Pseudomonadota bacterium]
GAADTARRTRYQRHFAFERTALLLVPADHYALHIVEQRQLLLPCSNMILPYGQSIKQMCNFW